VNFLARVVVLPDRAAGGARQGSRARDDRLQHRFEIEGRAQRPADVTERGQLVHRARELARSRLQLGQQPRVLDGDDGLVGEGAQELDLPLVERVDLVEDDHSHRVLAPQHRDSQEAPIAHCSGHFRATREPFLPLEIGDVQDLAPGQDPPGHGVIGRGTGLDTPCDGFPFRRGGAGERPLEPFAILDPPDEAVERPAQPDRALEDGVEDGLQIGPRGADHAEDLGHRRLPIERFREFRIARPQFFEQPHVLDGDDGLVGEGLEESDLLVGEQPGLSAARSGRANGHALPHHGDAEDRAKAPPPRVLAAFGKLRRLGLQVGEVDRPRLEDRAPTDRPTAQRHGERRNRAVMGGRVELVAVAAKDDGVECLAQPSGAFRQRVEHRLDVRRRATDDAQNLARRRLLFESVLRLLEDPRVLEGDDGLVGEGVQEGDLAVRKGPGSKPSDGDGADHVPVLQQGDTESASKTRHPRQVADGAFRIIRQKRNVHDRPGQDRPAERAASVRSDRKRAPHGFGSFSPEARESGQVHERAIERDHHALMGAGQSHRSLGHGVEHGLNVGRRCGDDPQDLARGRLLRGQFGLLASERGNALPKPLDLGGQIGLRRPGRAHRTALASASAFSSQNGMSISRYIAVAMLKCSCACSSWPVRR
jgi:hypothetical protein